ncbi:MAG: hypothetical protein JWN27_3967 [Candidatus Eremiobacteraeota bacterium]|nr:hypothetical protein [Candidatus Eremiobacteraeota bacterium]
MTDAARSSTFAILSAGSGVPAAGYGTVLLIDTLRCNVGHAIFLGMFGLIWLVPLVAGAIAVSTLVLGLFPTVRVRPHWWYATCGVLATALVVTVAVWFGHA